LVTVPAHKNVTYELIATGAQTPQSNLVIITVNAINNTAIPQSEGFNFTLITFLSGPHFSVDIVEYDSSVTQGDHISSIKAKVSNIGNETATNVTITWTLPSGWTSRDTLSRNYSNLTNGGLEVIEDKITADVSENAATGQQTILIQVDSAEGVEGSDSRTVTVNELNPSQTPSSESSSSSSSRSSSSPSQIFIAPPDIYIDLDEIFVPRGEYYETEFVLINNVSFKNFENIKLELEGIFRNFYIIEPSIIELLEYEESTKAKLIFELPDYFPEGSHELNLLIMPENKDTIVKPFEIIVYDNQLPLQECLNSSKQTIDQLREEGVNIEELYEQYKNSLQ